ncbi:alpha/beta-hydrolase [Fomes fomentarius]|nr:alpha/beta-hydrolase [Fomes fomentarius]
MDSGPGIDTKTTLAYLGPPKELEPAAPVSRRCIHTRRARIFIHAAITAAIIFGVQYYLLNRLDPLPVPDQTRNPEIEFDWWSLEPKKDLVWTPCYTDQKCARLLLPLDYDTPDSPTTAIALQMIPAADKQNYRGSLFINPGGPGGSGTNLVHRMGKNISRIVGANFDVLGFDPRGTGWTRPAAVCFDTESKRDIWNSQEGYDSLNASDPSLGLFHARAKALADRCEDKLGGEWGIGRFVSTAYVARDMLEISHKLGQDQIQYWGFSYGSVLGQYFAAMYPDKNYRATLWNTNIVDVDEAVGSLFEYCHRAGPEKCALYESTPGKIRERYFRVLDSVEKNPVPVSLAEPPVVITRKALVSQLFYGTYKPITLFPNIIDTIYAIETTNATALTALASKIVATPECECGALPDRAINDSGDTEATFAIACGDGDRLEWDPESYKEYYKTLEDSSHLIAPHWGHYWLQCSAWTIRPKWRWTGPLEAKNTSHPILVLSTQWDPVTPLPDALAAHERYGGSGLLVQNSIGHCSLSTPSLCTAKHVRRYFQEGTLPKEGTRCDVEELPLIGQVESEGLRAMSVEDAELLDALKGLSESMPSYRGL